AGGSTVKFTVHPGDSLSTLGPSLESAGVIDSPRDFKIWLRVSGSSLNLEQGDYNLRRRMPYHEVVTTLARGPVVVSEGLLLREGLTVTETATAVGALKLVHISPDAFEAAATSATVVPEVPAPGRTTPCRNLSVPPSPRATSPSGRPTTPGRSPACRRRRSTAPSSRRCRRPSSPRPATPSTTSSRATACTTRSSRAPLSSQRRRPTSRSAERADE